MAGDKSHTHMHTNIPKRRRGKEKRGRRKRWIRSQVKHRWNQNSFFFSSIEYYTDPFLLLFLKKQIVGFCVFAELYEFFRYFCQIYDLQINFPIHYVEFMFCLWFLLHCRSFLVGCRPTCLFCFSFSCLGRHNQKKTTNASCWRVYCLFSFKTFIVSGLISGLQSTLSLPLYKV